MVEHRKGALKERTLKKQARRQSIKEGLFASGSLSVGGKYLSPFAIAINTSSSLVAMLSAIEGLLGPISQMFGSNLMDKHSRKKIVMRAVLTESLLWLPIIAVALLFQFNILTQILPIALLVFFSFYIISGNIGYPAFFSWSGDIVDPKFRGRWLSKRQFFRGFIAVILTITSSFLLEHFKNQGETTYGFITLFSLAMLLRLVSVGVFKKQYEPKLDLKKTEKYLFKDFLKNLKKNNFGRFTIFRTFLALTASISSPLIAIYVLRNLEYSYITYMLILSIGTLFSIFSLGFWGKIEDKFGSHKVLILSSILIPFIPLLWILSPSKIYLILVPATVGSIAWAGFRLGVRGFAYESLEGKKRGSAISYFSLMRGIGTFAGAGIGALLIKYVQTDLIQPIVLIFLIGAVLRAIAIIKFLPKVREVGKKRKFKGIHSIKQIVMHETKSTLMEEAHEIMHIKKYLSK